MKALDGLTEAQKEAIKYVVKKSKAKSKAQYPALKKRTIRYGWKEDDLKRVIQYVRDEAPIIIHVHIEQLIHYFLNDTHYRNQFETNRSCGYLSHSTRMQWEKRMFHKIYDDSPGFERVKYGVLNMVNDPNGINSCLGYGTSHFVLKGVRLRTSFADRDTSANCAKIASCEYYCHVLAKYKRNELIDLLDVAKNIRSDPKYHKSSTLHSYNYKEVQIHGEVRFDTHIAAIRLSLHLRYDQFNLPRIKEFATKNNISDVTFVDGTNLFDLDLENLR